MRLSHTKLLLALAAALGVSAATAATWAVVATVKGERIELDKSRITHPSATGATAWSRLAFERDFIDEYGLRYTSIEALNRYDCEKHSFVTVKRVYRRDSQTVREETVASPREMAAEPGGADEKLLAEACKTRTVGAGQRGAETTPKLAAEAREGRPTVMYADMRATESGAKPPLKSVADKPAETKPADAKSAEKPAEQPSGERPRYIDLPKIDKSKLETATTGAAAPVDAKAPPKTPDPKAAAKPAARSERTYERGVDAPVASRHELERQYASSGPRRTPKKPAADSAVVEHRSIHWSYEGEGGPANWSKLRAEYATCATGRRQSPIDIREGIKVDLEPIQFDYKLSHFTIVDNGHTVQVNVSEGSTIRVMEREYRLVQFHFHRPAEERIAGRAFDMVVHLVHKDDDGKLAVVAVLLEKGSEHPLIQTLWNHMPLEQNQEIVPSTIVDLTLLLPPPEKRAYYTYMGSLTTPPCTEDVLWMVFKQPVQVSPQQISIFSRLYSNNARPVQPSNGRLLKESR